MKVRTTSIRRRGTELKVYPHVTDGFIHAKDGAPIQNRNLSKQDREIFKKFSSKSAAQLRASVPKRIWLNSWCFATSKPSISFSGSSTGNFLRGQTLELELIAAAPNSAIELGNLTISVADGSGEIQQISSEPISGFTFSKLFSYDFSSIGELLVFTFKVSDNEGNEAIQTYTANVRPFDITFSPDIDTLEVTTGDEVILNISADLPENVTSIFESLTIFKSIEGEETQVGDVVALSGVTMSEGVTYTVVDTANQILKLRLEIKTSEGEKKDREIVLKIMAVEEILSLSDIKSQFRFNPNPVTAAEGFKLSVSSALLVGNAATFKMSDVAGRQVEVNVERKSNEVWIVDMENLSKGIYLLTVSGDGFSFIERLIK